MKPSIFRWLDAATFGLVALLAVAEGVAVTASGVEPIAVAVTWITVAGVVGLYVALLVSRAAAIGEIDFVTAHGLLVCTNGFPVTQEAVEAETERVLEEWHEVNPIDEETRDVGSFLTGIRGKPVAGVWVKFMPHPRRNKPKVVDAAYAREVVGAWLHEEQRAKLAGLASNVKPAILVGWLPDLSQTALGHELGHVILRRAIGDGSEVTLQRYHKEWGVPF